eukprot:g37229.t1
MEDLASPGIVSRDRGWLWELSPGTEPGSGNRVPGQRPAPGIVSRDRGWLRERVLEQSEHWLALRDPEGEHWLALRDPEGEH